MSTSAQDEMAERRRVLMQDASVREGSTFHQHAQASANDLAGGRFAAVSNAYVVGSTSQVNYPAAGPHQSDPCGLEPPLGYRIDDLDALEPLRPEEAQGLTDPTSADAPPAIPLSGAQRADVGSLSSGDPAPSTSPSGDELRSPTMAAQGKSQMSSSTARDEGVRPERSPPLRRF
jgi:hypothetical protein